MRSNPAPTLERIGAYDKIQQLIAEGTERSPAILMAKLRRAGLSVPSRETVRRWALNTTSPSSSMRLFVPKPSEELSFFIGAWIGDGWADESDGGKRLVMKVRSFDFAKEFADCAAKILGKSDSYWVRSVNDKRGRWYLVKVTSILLYDFVNQPLKELIPVISPNPRGFLRGVFTAEGNPSVSFERTPSPWLDVGVVVSNNDLDLLQFVRALLVRMGYRPGDIRLNFAKGKRTNFGVAKGNGWLLSISRRNGVEEFASSIGFADSEKQTKLLEALSLVRDCGRRRAAQMWLARYEKSGKKWIRRTTT